MSRGIISASGTNTLVSTAAYDVPDDILFTLGNDSDIAMALVSGVLAADAELTGVVEGTSDHIGTAANSLYISNITNDGDVHILVSKAGSSHTAFLADGSTGDTILNAATGQSVDLYVAGTKEYDFSASAIAMNDNNMTGIGDLTFTAGSIIKSGSTTNDTLLIAANDTTFITLTTAATDVCTAANITMSGTWLASGTVTVPALTLGGAIAGGDQAFTGVGDMTFTAASIITAGSTNADTLLVKAGGVSGTTFITLTSNATDTMDLGAHTISGKLTAGATEIEGSGFDIDGGDISAVTVSGGLTWSAAQNLGAYTTYINETANTNMTVGLTINKGANVDESIALKGSFITHQMTDFAEADTFGVITQAQSGSGGLALIGYKDSTENPGGAVSIFGRLGEAADTTKSTAGRAIVEIWSQITDGSASVTTPGAGQNLFSVRASATTVVLVNTEGDVWADGTLFLSEQSAARTDTAGLGQFWVKNDTPNTPYFTDDTGVDRQIQTADYAGILVDANAGATTIDLVDNFVLIDVFDTDMPEAISNGAHGTDNITVGATGVYRVRFDMSGNGGGTNKTFEVFAFELNASGEPIASTTAANPVVVTDVGHPFVNGNRIKITGVTTADELNDRIFTVTKLTADTYSLQDDEGVNIDGTGFGAGTGGTATLATILTAVHTHRKFATADVGSMSGGGLVSLTKDKTLELYIKGTTDTTNPTIEYCSFYMNRVS